MSEEGNSIQKLTDHADFVWFDFLRCGFFEIINNFLETTWFLDEMANNRDSCGLFCLIGHSIIFVVDRARGI